MNIILENAEISSRIGEFQGAESVEEAHPDALMDGIASRILDTIITDSRPTGIRPRVAVEGTIKGNDPEQHAESFSNGVLMLVGEVTTPDSVLVNFEDIARSAIRDRGYTDPTSGFSADTVEILSKITHQSKDIDCGVTGDKQGLGAGDQGITIGAAVANDGPEYMPMSVMIAQALTNRLTLVKREKIIDGLRRDGKSQVVLRYHNGKMDGVHSITVASAHEPSMDLPEVQHRILTDVIRPVFDQFGIKIPTNTIIQINGAGAWNKNGPSADAGEVGRKLAVAFLSGLYPIGGGTPFGKDPSKVDLTGALIARHAARFIVERGLATKAEVDIYWTIGQKIPDAIGLKTFGTQRYPLEEINRHLARNIAFSVSGAIDQMRLFDIQYEPLSAGGIFGRPEYPWEQVPSL